MLQAQIFLDADEHKGELSLQDFILQFLLKHKVKGATVFRGQFGFGERRRMMRPHELFSFDEIPLMITFIDEDEIVIKALTNLRKEWKKGFIVTHDVKVWGE
ncbi:MAG: hypothetical protein CRN43_20275 [Candidatus Nephrothrix sp. EaCA]|nr:MAG: hypothetical protein CRN43_20275 [Candidatus Nephrothrix sp. EaCA]